MTFARHLSVTPGNASKSMRAPVLSAMDRKRVLLPLSAVNVSGMCGITEGRCTNVVAVVNGIARMTNSNIKPCVKPWRERVLNAYPAINGDNGLVCDAKLVIVILMFFLRSMYPIIQHFTNRKTVMGYTTARSVSSN